MICLIALVVFGILGIFSVKYRVIAKEALDCVFRRVTLRKCDTGLDKRLRSQITGNLMRKAPRLGRFTFKNFEIISWVFTILMILSIVQSGISVYNFAAYGNCNGKGSDEFCIFDPFNSGTTGHDGTEGCSIIDGRPEIPLLTPIRGDSPSIGINNSPVTMVEFGCYTCQYTIKAEENMIKIREKYSKENLFVFKHFPIPNHNLSYESAIAAECAGVQSKFWEYHELLFDLNGEITMDNMKVIAGIAGLDTEQFNQCLDNNETKEMVDADINEGKRIGIFGTPTFFANEEYVIGPKSFREYKNLINKVD